jgi:D-alanine transaminase
VAEEEGLQVEERPTPIEELAAADEVFLTGTTTEVKPVVRIDGRAVGKGNAGPVTKELMSAFLRRVEWECGVSPGQALLGA